MNKLKIASIQMISTPHWEENLNNAISLIKKAADQGAKLIVLPEFFIRIGENKPEQILAIAEDIGVGKVQNALKDIAKECRIYLVAGTIPIKSRTAFKCYNTTIVYNNHGEMVCYYNKVHLFKLNNLNEKIDESINYEHGSDVVTFNMGNFSFGLSICYDLRFPELFREMVGIDAIILPAAFTHYTGAAHWEVLLRARAIENQCYVIASAQGGVHKNGRHTFGHSMIIDPWGDIKELIQEGEGIVFGEIDKDIMSMS